MKSVNPLRQCGAILYFKPSLHVACLTAGGAASVSEGLSHISPSLSSTTSLELLREVAPQIKRVAMLREPGPAAIGQWAAMQGVAHSLKIETKPIDIRESADIERDVSAFAQSPNRGMIIAVSAAALEHKDLIIKLATQHRLPVVYSYRVFVTHGGLMSYATDITGQYKRAAGYVARILKGEKPADLPVQEPIKYELVINLKSARASGITVPPSLLSRADELIE